MAKITYENKVALNQNSSIPDINKVNDTDMNMIKNVVNNNETKVLLAVSSSAPATCDTGDMYFNTTNNLIYTATATNTWSSTGVAPTENTIYIEFTSQTAYAYDGTTLVSVGGGSGSEIVIGDEEPTEDTKMIIDTDAFDPQYSDITDEYSEANNKAYSCDYVNGTVLYENANGGTGNIPLNSSKSNFRKLEIIFGSNTTEKIHYLIDVDSTATTLSRFYIQGTYLFGYFSTYTLEEQQLTLTNYARGYFPSNIVFDANFNSIYKVIGYK